jgi:UDP-N-acetyl-D-galactosamine dehydrogenase
VYDPIARNEEAKKEYGLELISEPKLNHYQAIVLAVGHDEFKQLGAEKIRRFGSDNSILYDVKHLLPKELVDGRL